MGNVPIEPSQKEMLLLQIRELDAAISRMIVQAKELQDFIRKNKENYGN